MSKIKIIMVLVLCYIYSVNIFGQLESPIDIVYKSNYFDSYVYLESNKNEYINSKQRNIYYQLSATLLSFVGKYEKADSCFAKYYSVYQNSGTTCLIEDVVNQDQLTSLYTSTNILLFNEAHHIPKHRAFLISQLEILKSLGYKYLALETLSKEDSNIMSRGYPKNFTGFYTKDPIYGNLIRKAIDLGIQLISYDYYSGIRRDIKGVDEICKQYNKHKGKLIVLAGYGHIYQDWPMLGKSLMKNLDEEVLSISQISKIDSYTGFTNDSSITFYLKKDKSKSVDYFLLYNQKKSVGNIPYWYSWVYSEYKPLNKLYSKKIKKPSLVQITNINEEKGIPVFQYMIEDEDNIDSLIIAVPTKGEYLMIIQNKTINDTINIQF